MGWFATNYCTTCQDNKYFTIKDKNIGTNNINIRCNYQVYS